MTSLTTKADFMGLLLSQTLRMTLGQEEWGLVAERTASSSHLSRTNAQLTNFTGVAHDALAHRTW